MAQTKTKNGVTYKKTTGKWFKAGASAKGTGGTQAAAAGRVTPADYIRLGPDAAKIKSQLSPSRWRQVVKTAHDQGWTVESALDSSTPAALKQKTQTSLRAAAARTVNDAYAPQQAELDQADRQNQGLREKRLSDQSAYDQWASQRAAETAGQVNAAQQKYLDIIKASTDSQIQDSQQRQQQLQARVQQGAVGDMSGSVALTNAAQAAGAEQERARLQQQNAAASTPVAAERAAAIPLAALGAAYKRRAQIEGDYNKAGSDILGARSKLNVSKAADQIDLYSKSLSTEMDKASANRDFAGLQAQLQSKQDIQDQKHQEFLLGQKGLTSRAKLAASTTRRGQTLSHTDRVADRAARQASAAAGRASREAIAAADRAAKGQQNLKDRAKIVGVIDTIAAILKNQQKGPKGKAGSGYLWDPSAKQYRPARQVLISYYQVTSPQIDAGLQHARGKLLTPQQKAALGLQ
jgi:hypothetical protein